MVNMPIVKRKVFLEMFKQDQQQQNQQNDKSKEKIDPKLGLERLRQHITDKFKKDDDENSPSN